MYSNINSALDKLEPYEGKCFRGTALLESDFKRYLSAYESDSYIVERAFTSTGLDEEMVKGDFMDNTFIEYISKSGKPIVKYAEYKDESEVLFRSHTRFKVLGAIKAIDAAGDSLYTIKLEEL